MAFEYTPDDQDIQDNYAVGRAGGDLCLSLAEMRAEYGPEFDQWLSAHDARVRAEAAREALDGLEADTAQIIRTMRERGEQGWARYAIANDILDAHRTRHYPKEDQ